MTFYAGECSPTTANYIVTGFADNVMPDAGPPPFPDAGLEGSPASQTAIEAMLGSSGEFGNRADGEQADPVNSRSGNYVAHTTDAAMPAVGLPLVAERTYNSLDSTAGILGRGWSMTYQERLVVESPTSVVFVSAEGQRIRYTKTGTSWSAPANITAALTEVSNGWILTTRDQTRYRFLTSGALLWIKDRNSEGVSISRDTQGRVNQVTNGGRWIGFAYNADGRLATLTMPGSRTVTFGYTDGLLTSITDPRNKTTTYGYFPDGKLKWERDADSVKVMELAYDATTGRVTDQWDARGKHTTFAWDLLTETSRMVDPRGGAWVDDYEQGVLARRVDPLERAWSYYYDAKLQLRRTEDPRGVTSTYTYNASGDLTSSFGRFGRIETTYNAKHDPVRAVNAKGVATDYGYDAAGNITSITRTTPAGDVLTETFTVNSRGLITAVTDARGKTTTLGYNTDGDLTSTTSPEGRVSTFTYTSTGQVETAVAPPGNVTGNDPTPYTTTYTYNALDEPLSATHPTLGTTSATYDNLGRQVTLVDAKYRTTSLDYDDAGHLISVQGPDQTIPPSTATYDDNGNLTSTTDTSGRTVSYVYDLAAQITKATTPSGTHSYTYDEVGNLLTAQRLNGSPVTLTYNSRNQLTKIDYTSTSTTDVVYTYDKHGNRTSMTDAAGTVNYAFNDLDQLTKVERAGAPTFTYSYDHAGNITATTGPNGNLSYDYTPDGLLDTVTTNPTGTAPTTLVDYSYGQLGLPTRAEMANGTYWERGYDSAGRLLKISHKRADTTKIFEESYTLDKAGNPTSFLTDTGATAARTDTLTYDTLDRLTGICYNTTTCAGATDYVTWSYDPAGNRTSETRPTGQTTYTYQQATGRLESINGPPGSESYTYDVYGRLTTKTATPAAGQPTTTTYGYNEASQLRTITTDGQTTANTYDGDGRRLTSKTPSGAVTTYSWDPRSYLLLARSTTPAGGGAPENRAYQYGLGPVAYTTGDPTTAGATYNYTHTDLQGSLRAVTDAAGIVDRRRSWEPYGVQRDNQVIDTSSPTPGIGWAGEVENTNGTVHLRARNYDPTTGRFTTPDPANSTSVSATYTYAGANPMTGSDPYGLSTLSNIFSGIAEVAPYVANAIGFAALVVGGPVLGPAAAIAGAAAAGFEIYKACTSEKGACGQTIALSVLSTATGGALGAFARSARALRSAKSESSLSRLLGGRVRDERGAFKLPGGGPLSPNQMNQTILRGNAPSGFTRVDRGKIPGEQTHIHFEDGSALNMDGTWKHGGTTITNAQAEWLEANGWMIPR